MLKYNVIAVDDLWIHLLTICWIIRSENKWSVLCFKVSKTKPNGLVKNNDLKKSEMVKSNVKWSNLKQNGLIQSEMV